MNWVAQTILAGLASFVATNVDDLVILMLFFSQVGHYLTPRHIVVGHTLGFSLLVLASSPGFLGGLVIPKMWIGLLGFLPLAIGIYQLLNRQENAEIQAVSYTLPEPEVKRFWARTFSHLLPTQTLQVAAVTLANGGDNISIYLPLFASSNREQLAILLSVFFTLSLLWCYIGYQLSRHPVIAPILTRHGHAVVPFVLIGLGLFILFESNAYRLVFQG